MGHEHDANDAAQEVFVRLAQTGSSLGEVSKPKAYLLGMTHRAAVDLFRSRRRTQPLDEVLLLDGGSSPREQLAAREASLAVAKLTPEHREVIYLRHFSDLTFSEIGKTLGISLFTAASRHRLALNRLRRLLGVAS
jgi:RNA polymerase sigma-70 factor (ECF subfamily)